MPDGANIAIVPPSLGSQLRAGPHIIRAMRTAAKTELMRMSVLVMDACISPDSHRLNGPDLIKIVWEGVSALTV